MGYDQLRALALGLALGEMRWVMRAFPKELSVRRSQGGGGRTYRFGPETGLAGGCQPGCGLLVASHQDRLHTKASRIARDPMR